MFTCLALFAFLNRRIIVLNHQMIVLNCHQSTALITVQVIHQSLWQTIFTLSHIYNVQCCYQPKKKWRKMEAISHWMNLAMNQSPVYYLHHLYTYNQNRPLINLRVHIIMTKIMQTQMKILGCILTHIFRPQLPLSMIG